MSGSLLSLVHVAIFSCPRDMWSGVLPPPNCSSVAWWSCTPHLVQIGMRGVERAHKFAHCKHQQSI